GTTVILVSHSIDQIERLCNRVTWLEKGKVRMSGDAQEVCAVYKKTTH
ncbi:MAG: ABC transporter ATP-binding protein, partial [Ruthenibacterium sp.]